MDRERLTRKQQAAARTGGKGTRRRKQAAVAPNRAISREEQRFREKFDKFYRGLQWSHVAAVEGAHINIGNTEILFFDKPAVSACKTQNLWIISGIPTVESVEKLLTSLISRFGVVVKLCSSVQGAENNVPCAGLPKLCSSLQITEGNVPDFTEAGADDNGDEDEERALKEEGGGEAAASADDADDESPSTSYS